MSTPFLTDIDSRAAIKGSRDPLGFGPVWSSFGRRVVGNLTTVSNSVRGFTTTLLGYYFAQAVQEHAQGKGQSPAQVFLKFEQLAAYSRYAAMDDGDFRGIDRVKRRIHDGDRIVLSVDPDEQILADQKVYGLWGLFSVPASESGLVDRDRLCLTDEARTFVEHQYIAELGRKGLRDGRPIVDLLKSKEATLRLDSDHRQLAATLARMHAPDYGDDERAFYRAHLVLGGPNDKTDRRQQHLAELLLELPPGDDFGMNELVHVIRLAEKRGAGWEPVADCLDRIRTLELLLVPCSSAFSYVLSRHGQTLDRLGSDMARAWGPRLGTVNLPAIKALEADVAKAYGAAEPATRLVSVAAALSTGNYAEALKLLIDHNAGVMIRRGAAAWVRLDNDRVDVRLEEELGDLAGRAELRAPWRNTYFINSLHRVQMALEARRGR